MINPGEGGIGSTFWKQADELIRKQPRDTWPDWRERFDHRAGVCEFDGELSAEAAERMAFEELKAILVPARFKTGLF